MKVNEVLVKVFEPGRLQMAWQQVKTNAGAAGDRSDVLHDFSIAFSRAYWLGHRSRSGIPGRYVPFCWEGVAYGLPPTR